MLSQKEIDQLVKCAWDGMVKIPKEVLQRVQGAIDKNFKLPVFLRTDQSSCKHDWKNTCYYDGSDELSLHIYRLIEGNLCADIMGLDFKAIAVREFIPMESMFTAFYGDMPVNPEIRFFIKDGVVLCWHWYWIEEAIAQSKSPSIPLWRDELRKKKDEISGNEILLLNSYAKKVAEKFEGGWSVDFCKAKDGRWILIDMARSHRSWHPKDCKFNETKDVDLITGKEITEKDVKVMKR